MNRRALDRLNPPPTHPAATILHELAAVMRRVVSGLGGTAVLDLGAGDAPYRSLFKGYATYVTADLPGEGADLDILDGHVAAPDASFDAVVSTQVLEHVPDPDRYLAEAHRLLQPDGALLLSTHGIYWYHPSPEDLWRWTGPGLRRQIERCGFVVEELIPVLSAPAAALSMLCQYAAGLVVPTRLRGSWNRLSQRCVRLVDRIVAARGGTPDDACVFVVLARPRARASAAERPLASTRP